MTRSISNDNLSNQSADNNNTQENGWTTVVAPEPAHIILVPEHETFTVNDDTTFNHADVIFGLATGAKLEIKNTRLVPTKITVNMKVGSLCDLKDTDFVSTEIIFNMDAGARVLINQQETIAQEDQSVSLTWDGGDVEHMGADGSTIAEYS